MKKFVTIKEAGALTGKAEITIRRMIKRLLSQDSPETKQLIRQTKSSSGYQYQIDTEFLLKELNMDYLLNNQKDNQETKPEDTQDSQTDNHKVDQVEKAPETKAEMGGHEIIQSQSDTIEMLKETISILREQLLAKDRQISDNHVEKHELIRGNREAIVTVNRLSEKLLLEEAKEPEPELVDDVPGDVAVKSGTDNRDENILDCYEDEEEDEEQELQARKKWFNIFK
jgi:hypothetical protein